MVGFNVTRNKKIGNKKTFSYLVKGEKLKGIQEVSSRSQPSKSLTFTFSQTISFSSDQYANCITEGLFAKSENNFYIKISIDSEDEDNFLIRLFQGLVEVHLPKKFHELNPEEKQSHIDVIITWKFDWISSELYGLGKLSPKKGKICCTELLITLDDYIIYLKSNDNEPPKYPLPKKQSGSFKPFASQRKGKVGSKSSKRYIKF